MVHVTCHGVLKTFTLHKLKMQAHATILRRHSRSATCARAARSLASSVAVTGRRRRSPFVTSATSLSLVETSPVYYSSLTLTSRSRLAAENDARRIRSYSTLPSSSSSITAAIGSTFNDNNYSASESPLFHTTSCALSLQKRHKVFVSKHNQTLNLSAPQITSYLCQQLPHLSDHATSDHFRITSSHVIMKECPFCTKPTNDKPDNFYKIYIALGGGAYFCHRCGAKGSWYDLKSELGGFAVVDKSEQSRYNYQGQSSSSVNHAPNGTRHNYPHQQQQQQQPARPIQPLPMPHPKLNSLHSSRLFNPANSPTTHTNEYNVLHYLEQTRGLTKSVLRKYGVGCASYQFPTKNKSKGGRMEYVSSMCVTFPWLMRQGEIEEQEELRGARYQWRSDDDNEDDVTNNDTKVMDEEMERQRQQERETMRRLEAAAKAAKKNVKSRSEMTALERYNAKRERRAARKKKVVVNDDEDENDSNECRSSANDDYSFLTQQKQSPPPHSQQLLEPLTSDQIEALQGPYTTRRIKVRSIEQKSWQRLDPPGGGFGLFGWHTIPHDATEIIITEGEFDAMAVYQATGRHAVSLPNGCRSLPMEVLVLLERFDTVYLWMDNDGPGREGAEMFARKLGVERCLLVQPSGKRGWNGGINREEMMEGEDELDSMCFDAICESRPPPPPKDANEALLQGWDINELLNEASELPHERILKFSDLRDQVIHEITNPDKYRGVPLPSLPGFSSIIKGFRRGEMTVLTGPTGSGKTTFLGQQSLDLAEQNVNVLWGSFEIKNTRLMHKLLQQYMKDVLPVGLEEKDVSREDKKKLYDELTMLADKFDALPLYFMKFHGGSDIDDVLDAMEYAAYVHDVEHIILDNMQFMISRDVKKMSSSFDKFDMQDIAIEKFRKFATDYNVHVTLVVHPRKEDEGAKLGISSFYGSAKATQEADTVLILQHDGKRKFVEVKKNRFDGTLGHSPLHFDRKSGRYSEDAPVKPQTTMIPSGVGAKTFNGVGHNAGRAKALSSNSSLYNDMRSQHPL